MIKLKVGGFYRTRDGRKVGPMEPSGDRFGPYWPFTISHDFDGGGQGIAWRAGGEFSAGRHAADLVAEWVEPETLKRKFNVGDKVRRVKNGCGYAPIGFETAITSCDGERVYFRDVYGCEGFFWPEYWELIEPAHQGPVRTVTTTSKVIEPGVFGRLAVGVSEGGKVAVGFAPMEGPAMMINLSASEILAAGKHLIEIAGAMEGGQ